MEHFNKQANEWDTEDKIKQNKMYADAILKHISHLKLENVLEFGCGTGLLGENFINDNTSLLGIDTSQGMLDVFNNKFKGNPKVRSLLFNLEKSDLDNNYPKFDLIISSMAFHHIESPEKMIIKLQKMLTPEGVLAIIDLDLEDGSFHSDPKNMGVHHFGFSEETSKEWKKMAHFKHSEREIIIVLNKNNGKFPIFLNIFSN
jgi:2-polyprenyl-3-methyl-5-hydroxy-6-metoxy-1,4-benzoquinol methylase